MGIGLVGEGDCQQPSRQLPNRRMPLPVIPNLRKARQQAFFRALRRFTGKEVRTKAVADRIDYVLLLPPAAERRREEEEKKPNATRFHQ